MKTTYYVYAYIDPATGSPFYIGKGKGQRAKAHLRPCDVSLENSLSIRIRGILGRGHRPLVVFLLERLSETESLQWEMFFIKALGRTCDKTGPLLNATYGGQGLSGRKHSAATKLKISLAAKGRVILPEARKKMSEAARNRSPETKERQAAPRRGGKRTLETRLKQSQSRKGRVFSESSRRKISAAAEIRQYVKHMTRIPMSDITITELESW